MKFNEFPYARPDLEKLTSTVHALIERVKNATEPQQLFDCIREMDEIGADIESDGSIASVRYTLNVKDEYYQNERKFWGEAEPQIQQLMSDFMGAVLDSPFLNAAKERFGALMFDNAIIQRKTIAPEVIADLAEEARLTMEYARLTGSAQIEFNGEVLGLPAMGKYMDSADRDMRKRAFEAYSGYFYEHKEEFDKVFSELAILRERIAKKLGQETYTQLGYLRMTRNCYKPENVAAFREQVKRDLVPFINELKAEQAKQLGISSITIYDDKAQPKELDVKPIAFDEELYQIGIQMYRDMSPETKVFIESMDEMGCFDLLSYAGKQPGGYCTFIPRYETPFIFANFNGTTGDVDVFTHEGGHAYYVYMASRKMELGSQIMPTMDMAEIHSMSMEFMCWPSLERFYGDKTDIAKRKHLISSLSFIPYGCMVDEFQHRVYENPNMSVEDMNKIWLELEAEYRPFLDFDGIPFYAEGRTWQRQGHIYQVPFYYIDYCLAQCVSLQFFELMQREGFDKAWETYNKLVNQGAMKNFTDLLDYTGLKNPFEDGALKGIIEMVRAWLNK